MQRSLGVHCSIKSQYDNPGRLEQAVSGEPGLASASGGSKLDSSQTTFLTPLSLQWLGPAQISPAHPGKEFYNLQPEK